MAIKYTGSYITCDTEADVLAMAGRAGDVAYALDTKMRYQYLSGGTWFPTDAVRVLRGTTTVNLMTAASTKILTIPPTSFRFVALGVHTEVTTLTGTIITQATISVGATATNYNDIAASQLLVGTLATLGLTSTNALTLASSRAALAGSTDIYVKVTVGAIGPTVYTARFDLFGYYEV